MGGMHRAGWYGVFRHGSGLERVWNRYTGAELACRTAVAAQMERAPSRSSLPCRGWALQSGERLRLPRMTKTSDVAVTMSDMPVADSRAVRRRPTRAVPSSEL